MPDFTAWLRRLLQPRDAPLPPEPGADLRREHAAIDARRATPPGEACGPEGFSDASGGACGGGGGDGD